jgi:hypothetical protein
VSRNNDKRKKQQNAQVREAAKREACIAKNAAAPKREARKAHTAAPQNGASAPTDGLVTVPARVDFGGMDMLSALDYVVDVNTQIIHGKIPRDAPTLFLLVDGEPQRMVMLAIEEGVSCDGAERQRELHSLGEAIGSAPWAEDLCAVFFAAASRLRNSKTFEVVKEVLMTGGIRPDGTNAVVACQDISSDTEGNILLSSAETSANVFSPLLLAFVHGLRSAIDRRMSA